MLKAIAKVAILGTTPLLIGACSTVSKTATAPTAATTVATSGTTPAVISTDRFPATISGGDGFQANPTKDASFATLINAVRTDAGSAPVSYNAKLDSAAQLHAQDMFAKDYFAHLSKSGTSVGDRVTAAGYTWKYVGENIAQGQQNENVAMNGWVKSAGHQANNINPNFKEFGLGRAGSGADTRWVLVLAAPN